jgi:hypothetical protein
MRVSYASSTDIRAAFIAAIQQNQGYLCLHTDKFIAELRRGTGISARQMLIHGLRDTSQTLLIRRRMAAITVTGSCVIWRVLMGFPSPAMDYQEQRLTIDLNYAELMELQGNRNVMWLGCH